MCRRHLIPYLAYGLALALAVPSVGQEHVAAQDQRVQNQEDGETVDEESAGKPDVLAPTATPLGSAKPAADSDNTEKYSTRENGSKADLSEIATWFSLRDTVAQWIMAVFGVVAVGISIWAVALVRRTLHATRDALKEAQRTTLVAEKALEETRLSNELQLRAYVYVSNTTWRIAKRPGTDEVTDCSLTIEWRNCGATPALRSRVMSNSDVLAGDLPSNYPYPDYVPPGPALSTKTERSNIGPGQPIQSRVGVKLNDAQMVAKNERLLFVWSWVEYDDIFDNTPRRRT